MFVVYQIRNIINNKVYIGCSKNYQKRWLEHNNKLNEDRHENIYLQRSWNKYKSSSFIFEIIKECDSEKDMFLDEINLINCNINKYNLSEGGQGGNTTKYYTFEQKTQLSINRSLFTKEQYRKGIRKTPLKFSELSVEEIKRRRKIWSETKRGRLNGRSKYHDIQIIQKDFNNIIIKIWKDIHEIRETNLFNPKYILYCCNKKENYESHKKYYWNFYNV